MLAWEDWNGKVNHVSLGVFLVNLVPNFHSCAMYTLNRLYDFTYDHRLRKTWYPVRSALIKPQIDRLVVGWVTTSESRLLYVFFIFVSGFLCIGWGEEKAEDIKETRR